MRINDRVSFKDLDNQYHIGTIVRIYNGTAVVHLDTYYKDPDDGCLVKRYHVPIRDLTFKSRSYSL